MLLLLWRKTSLRNFFFPLQPSKKIVSPALTTWEDCCFLAPRALFGFIQTQRKQVTTLDLFLLLWAACTSNSCLNHQHCASALSLFSLFSVWYFFMPTLSQLGSAAAALHWVVMQIALLLWKYIQLSLLPSLYLFDGGRESARQTQSA